MSEAPVGGMDPFSPENLAKAQFFVSCRIYDVLIAILKHADAAVARDILELHLQGNILGPSPSFNGNFLTDMMNVDGEANAEESNDEKEPTAQS